MAEGYSAQGTLVASSADPNWPPQAPAGGAVSFTNIAELRSIQPFALTRNDLENTTHNEQDESFLVGIRRKTPMTLALNFVPSGATHNHTTGLQYWWYTGERRIWRVRYPDGSAVIVSGFVTNVGATAEVDSILTADITIRPTGGTVWTNV
jgi:hypothetical protein